MSEQDTTAATLPKREPEIGSIVVPQPIWESLMTLVVNMPYMQVADLMEEIARHAWQVD